MYKGVEVIAEVKTHSPFKWAPETERTWEELFAVANRVGDIISIHTDLRWEGSFGLVQRARKLTDKRILAKGIHESDDDIVRAVQAGADMVLVVGRPPGAYADRCLIEPYTLAELQQIPPTVRAVWNSRDLATGEPKCETFAEARQRFGGWLCQASNVTSVRDIDLAAEAVLIGTHLEAVAAELVAS